MPEFFWDAERIAYYRDAAENSMYFHLLAARIASSLQPDDRVLDAGCGLGDLSFALLPYCRSVMAVDRDEQAIACLRSRFSKEPRMTAVCANVFELPLDFDAIVCCRFGSMKNTLHLFDASDARVLILVKRNDPAGRITDSNMHMHTTSEAVQVLIGQGRQYTESRITLSLDQPFRSERDALRFFQLYRGGDGSDARIDGLTGQLVKNDDPSFPLRFPIVHSLSVLTVYK